LICTVANLAHPPHLHNKPWTEQYLHITRDLMHPTVRPPLQSFVYALWGRTTFSERYLKIYPSSRLAYLRPARSLMILLLLPICQDSLSPALVRPSRQSTYKPPAPRRVLRGSHMYAKCVRDYSKQKYFSVIQPLACVGGLSSFVRCTNVLFFGLQRLRLTYMSQLYTLTVFFSRLHTYFRYCRRCGLILIWASTLALLSLIVRGSETRA
jgi:hypothetical protein